MFCGNCGKQIDDNVLACPYCKWVVTVMPDNNTPTIKVSDEKQILMISERVPELTLVQIVTNTNLEMEEAEIAIKKLVDKGIAKETVNSTGEKIYIFNNEAYWKSGGKTAALTATLWYCPTPPTYCSALFPFPS